MTAQLDAILGRAAAEGILPDNAAPPKNKHRSWLLVLLVAFGAWVLVGLLVVVANVALEETFSDHSRPYVAAGVGLTIGLIVLSARQIGLFAEQMALPALVVGVVNLAYGVVRDLPSSSGSAVLALTALVIALSVPRPWLRVLLGMVSAVLMISALLPKALLYQGHGTEVTFWISVHSVLALCLSSLWLQETWLNNGAKARYATSLEAIAAGWLISVLVSMTLLTGNTFLLGASFGGFMGSIGNPFEAQTPSTWLRPVTQSLSVGLALAGCVLIVRAWPSLRRRSHIGIAVLLLVLSWFQPMLGAVLLVLAITATTHRFRLASVALLATAGNIGSFFYQLQWPLAVKAAVLVAAGALLGAWAWCAYFKNTVPTESRATPAKPLQRMQRWLAVFGVVVTLAFINIGIWQKENQIANGQRVFIGIALAAPGFLFQEDTLHLRFHFPEELKKTLETMASNERPRVVAQRDEKGVATLLRLQSDDSPLAAGEFLIALTRKGGKWVFATDVWSFRNNDDASGRGEAVKFGEFRVAENGQAILVGLADVELKAIHP